MKEILVEDLIKRLQGVNPKARVFVIVHNYPEEFSLTHGGAEGCTEANCGDFCFYCDDLCDTEDSGE